jgi:hypothetical protein
MVLLVYSRLIVLAVICDAHVDCINTTFDESCCRVGLLLFYVLYICSTGRHPCSFRENECVIGTGDQCSQIWDLGALVRVVRNPPAPTHRPLSTLRGLSLSLSWSLSSPPPLSLYSGLRGSSSEPSDYRRK